MVEKLERKDASQRLVGTPWAPQGALQRLESLRAKHYVDCDSVEKAKQVLGPWCVAVVNSVNHEILGCEPSKPYHRPNKDNYDSATDEDP